MNHRIRIAGKAEPCLDEAMTLLQSMEIRLEEMGRFWPVPASRAIEYQVYGIARTTQLYQLV